MEIENTGLLESYDLYAAHALQALIAKMPLIDRDGIITDGVRTQEDIDDIKRQITKSAHGYAFFMVATRKEFVDALKKL